MYNTHCRGEMHGERWHVACTAVHYVCMICTDMTIDNLILSSCNNAIHRSVQLARHVGQLFVADMKLFHRSFSVRTTSSATFLHHEPVIHCMCCFRICILSWRRVRTGPTNKREAPAEQSHPLPNVYLSFRPRLKRPLSAFDFIPPSTCVPSWLKLLRSMRAFLRGSSHYSILICTS